MLRYWRLHRCLAWGFTLPDPLYRTSFSPMVPFPVAADPRIVISWRRPLGIGASSSCGPYGPTPVSPFGSATITSTVYMSAASLCLQAAPTLAALLAPPRCPPQISTYLNWASYLVHCPNIPSSSNYFCPLHFSLCCGVANARCCVTPAPPCTQVQATSHLSPHTLADIPLCPPCCPPMIPKWFG